MPGLSEKTALVYFRLYEIHMLSLVIQSGLIVVLEHQKGEHTVKKRPPLLCNLLLQETISEISSNVRSTSTLQLYEKTTSVIVWLFSEK